MMWLHNAVVACVYVVMAKLGLMLAFAHTNATPVWPPTGIALAACLVYGYRLWPGIFIGAFIANFTLPGSNALFSSLFLALAAATGNTLEALLGTFLVQRRRVSPLLFDRMGDTLRFILFGALLSPIVSASFGTAGFCAAGSNWQGSGQMWLTWWLGDVVSVLIFTPLLLTWQRCNLTRWPFRKQAEASALLLVLFLAELVAFRLNMPMEYLVIPILFWTAFRFGQFESSVAVFIVMMSSLFWTVNGFGPFAARPLNQALLFLHSYLGVAATVTLLVAVLIASRKRTESELRASEEHFRHIFEYSPIGIFQSTVDGNFINVNPILAAMFGYESATVMTAEVTRIADQIFVCPQERDRIIDKARSTTGFVREEIGYRRRDGTEFVANLIMRMVADGPGGVPYLEGFVQDITERKRAEKQLYEYQEGLEKSIEARTVELKTTNDQLLREIEDRIQTEQLLSEREAQYRDLVENANSVILRWRPDGEVIFINRFAENFFGFRSEEIIGRNFLGLIVPESDSNGRQLGTLSADIVARPEAYINNVNENIRKNGERVWVAWNNKPILSPDGSVTEVLSIGIDITKLVFTEKELRHALDELAVAKERAEAADRIKSAFLATMSHELRTPLNSIIGFTGILLQGLAGAINDEQAKQLTMVKSSANHLLSLISDVLDISKIEAGQLTVDCMPFQLADAIDKVIRTVQPLAEKKGIGLEVFLPRDMGTIRSDQRRFEQVLLNLLSNAVKFTESGGVTVDCCRDGNDYLVKVSDTGIGIRPEDAEHLFQPFYQIDSGLTRKYEGTGLGLSICTKLLELMGGSIRLESQPGRGSCFSFRLPAEREENS